MKLCNDQSNAQVFNLFISALHVSGFILAYLQRQLYNLGSGSSLLGMVSAPRKLEPLSKLSCLGRWALRKPETCKAEINR
jgi:hypothetical protein